LEHRIQQLVNNRKQSGMSQQPSMQDSSTEIERQEKKT